MNITYNTPRLLEAVDGFPLVKVLVIGDVMMDEFIWGRVERISPEAPVPVVAVTRETRLLGGAANVVNNLVSAGGRALLAGVVGQDRAARRINTMLKKLDVDPGGLIQDPGRPTTIKTRVVAHAQQVVRFDREKKTPPGPEVMDGMFAVLADMAGEADAIIISDYGKGVVSRELMNRLQGLLKGTKKVIAVDPKVNNFHLYKQATVITPNHHEAAAGSGVVIDSDESLSEAGQKIIKDLDCASVLITRGEQGMSLFEKDGSATHIPTVAREVFDVTGAGDTVIAVLTLGLAAGLPLLDAAVLANFAAGLVVGEVGTSAVTARELKDIVANGARRRKKSDRGY
ncbi:MAG: D-glycero-beta-D-manno-heptose-7-phosphate kinase [Thermodesulfobacteriota bacterium]|nr:D-glycero-beta-D-manno-heptose-7-phosphate kinase [Thermodesulfobacteriota bacterium]